MSHASPPPSPTNLQRAAAIADYTSAGLTIGAMSKGGKLIRAAGVTSVVSGVSQLVMHDKLQTSAQAGSAMQVAGGLVTTFAKTPTGLLRGGIVVIGGAAINAAQAHIHNRKLRIGLQTGVAVVTAGALLGSFASGARGAVAGAVASSVIGSFASALVWSGPL